MIRALVLFLISSHVFAAPLCEVYGISDSPQSVNCTFKGSKVEITCKNGVYFLNDEQVEAAFHLEVEEGPTPLVFQAHTNVLTLNLREGRNHEGILATGRKKLRGSCRI